MTYLTESAIDAADLLAAVQGPGRGGTALFLGTVRTGPEDGEVASIEYSAYREMVDTEFAKILADAEARWPEARVTGIHRVGDVPVGEASVGVAAAAPHRAEAFDACRYAIEEVKRRLPVWKKERFADGSTSWRDNDSVPADRA